MARRSIATLWQFFPAIRSVSRSIPRKVRSGKSDNLLRMME
jgi:hypothetical protein